MKKIILRISDGAPDAGKAEEQLSGLRIFASSYCGEHNVAAILAYRVQDGLDVACAMAQLEMTARKIAEIANQLGDKPLEN